MGTSRRSEARPHYRRLVGVVVGLALLIAAAASDPVYDRIRNVLDAAQRLIRQNPAAGMAVFLLLAALSAILFFFSAAIIVPVAVYTWGGPITIALLWVGWLAGGAISYWIGLRPGRRVVKWIVPARRITRYEKKISANATFPMVLLFQIAVPSEIPGYVLGALRYHFGRFMSARAVAELPFAIGTVYLGDTFVRRQYVPMTAIAVLGALASVVSLWYLHKRLEVPG